jgi:hypothetical protein
MRRSLSNVDKVVIKFFTDILYLKGMLCAEELEDIYDASTPSDLDAIFDKMMSNKYNVYKRGEGYVRRNEV